MTRTLVSADGTLTFSTAVADQYRASIAPAYRNFATLAEVGDTEIEGAGSTVLSITVQGLRHVYSASTPSDHDGYVTDDDGNVWLLDSYFVTPEYFGGPKGGSVDAAAAVRKCYAWAAARSPRLVLIDAMYGLASGVYVTHTGQITQGIGNRISGFKSLAADGYVRVGDSRTYPVERPGGVVMRDLAFDADWIGDVCHWWSYRCNGPSAEGCRFSGGVFAGLFVDLDVTQGTLVKPAFFRNGKSAAGVLETISDNVFTLGNMAIVGGVMGGGSGWAIRAMGSANNPFDDFTAIVDEVEVSIDPIIEELHVTFDVERFTSNLDGFILVESNRVAAPILGAVTGTFARGETITGGTSGATGEYWDTITSTDLTDNAKTMRMRNIVGTFQTSETLTGGTSGATTTISSITLGTKNQNNVGDIRVAGTTGYLENPKEYPGQDGESIAQSSGEAFVSRGAKSLLSVEWKSKAQFRKIDWGFSAENDGQIEILGGVEMSAQADGTSDPTTGLARTLGNGDGTARVIVERWPQAMRSLGNAVELAANRTPYRSWLNLVASGPHFGDPARLGIIGPNTVLVATPLDGTTAALPSVTTSAGAIAAAGGRVTYTADGSTVAGKAFAFRWTPGAATVGRKLMIVMTATLEQVGATFGGTGQLPQPRIRVQSTASPAHVWPADATSILAQMIPAPGAGDETGLFTCAAMFMPLTVSPLLISCVFSTATAASDDKMHVNSVRIFGVDQDLLGLAS